nr:putative retrotransposon Ty1-copia subclass protein [Tanacetum cinerariifolium]
SAKSLLGSGPKRTFGLYSRGFWLCSFDILLFVMMDPCQLMVVLGLNVGEIGIVGEIVNRGELKIVGDIGIHGIIKVLASKFDQGGLRVRNLIFLKAKATKERLDAVKSLMACKSKPEASICAFVLEMKGYFDRLESLNMVFDAELSINIFLSGLPTDYNQFVLSYQMNMKETLIMKLHSLKERVLIPPRKERPHKESPIVGLRERLDLRLHLQAIQRKQCASTATQKGHWKRSCPKYQKDLKDRKVEKGSLRRLKHGELNLVMGNRKIKLVTWIGKYELMLKSGVRIDLNNCCYSSEMTRNIISLHALFKDGYKFSFDNENGDILVYSNEDKISDSTLSELDEPANYKEAVASPEAAKWKESMKSEIMSMYDNQVWNLVDTTPGLKMVGCKWIFKKKIDMDGKVHTYKARFLVYDGEEELRVTGYCDASQQTNKDDSRLQSEEGHMIVKEIRSKDNPADPFTKSLAKSRHDEHVRSIGLKVKIPNVNTEQICILAFPYSLTGKARRWWTHEGNDEITSWVELVDKFFYKYYPLSHASKTDDANEKGYDNIALIDDDKSSDDESDHDNNQFFDPYLSAKDEGYKGHRMKCNDDTSKSENFV